jgi:hypothetical protein
MGRKAYIRGTTQITVISDLVTVTHRNNGPSPAHLIGAEFHLFRLLLTADIQTLLSCGLSPRASSRMKPFSLLSLRIILKNLTGPIIAFTLFIVANKLYS